MEILFNENDFHTSVEKALDEINSAWRNLPGLLIVGSHKPENIEKKIDALKQARIKKLPTLGICLGMQLMAIEYARNVAGMKNATSEEFGGVEGAEMVIRKLPRLHVGIDKVCGWWGTTEESHWHNYSFNDFFGDSFERDWDMSFSEGIVEIMRLKQHPFYVGVQFHPEYQSTEDKPHPVLVDFINACKKAI